MRKLFLLSLFLVLINFSCFAEDEKKVALLFMTRSELTQPQVWQEWVDRDKYNVYLHSKYSIDDPWLAQFWIGQCIPNEWGYTLHVQQALLQAALKDPSNYKFVFLSESCVPLRSNDEVHRILTADDQSYMRWYEIWWKGNPQRILSEFPEEDHYGNHQWIILNRKHTEMIANDNDWLPQAANYLCADEAYPSTFFSMSGVLHEFNNELTTYVDWQRGRPYVFKEHSIENLEALIDAKYNPNGHFGPRKCLFARKFAPSFPFSVIHDLIKGH